MIIATALRDRLVTDVLASIAGDTPVPPPFATDLYNLALDEVVAVINRTWEPTTTPRLFAGEFILDVMTRALDVLELPVPPVIQPDAQWTGVLNSGFGTANPAAPVNPTRTTAKPACRLLVPPRQWFTDQMLVGVAAMANYNGSLMDNLGLEKVVVHYEGNTADILRPSYQTFNDVNGSPVTYYGWWCWLKKPAGKAGYANAYFEAVPKNGAMQRRVIGPYLFAPQNVLHDLELTVAPSLPEIVGVRYQSIYAAQNYAKSQSKQNFLITVTEGGIYDLGDNNVYAYEIKGYCTITGTVPFTMGKAAKVNGINTDMIPNRLPLRFVGNNVTIDFINVATLTTAATVGLADYWLDGCTLTNTHPDGRFMLDRGGPTSILGWMVRGMPWFTECTISEIGNPVTSANLVRGCTVTRTTIDDASGARLCIGSIFADHSNENWNSYIPAFTVIYTGSETTATLARSGGTEGSGGGGVYTARWGANSATFNVGNGSQAHYEGTLGDGYWFEDVVAWLNTLPDFTAVLQIDPDRRACTACIASGKGLGFDGAGGRQAPINIKAVTAQIFSYHDKHGDWWQHQSGNLENVIAMDNHGIQLETQMIFLAPTDVGGANTRDTFFINNALHGSDTPNDGWDKNNVASQIGRNIAGENSHLVIAHNTLANQQLWLRNTGGTNTYDSYCLMGNNVFRALISAVTPANLVAPGNHLFSGSANPAFTTGTTIGGDEASLFGDAGAGDFDPAGDLLTNRKSPLVKFDMNKVARGTTSPVGAVA